MGEGTLYNNNYKKEFGKPLPDEKEPQPNL